MNYLKLCNEKLDIGTINDLVADDSCGAISMFVGTTRDNFEDKKVLSLEYEAYEPMAVKTMDKICDEIRSKWPDIKNIAMYHRLGIVPVKEASVIIAVSSPHRQTSLESVQYAIDELKKSVPIWKKEQYENDKASWKANKECPQSKYFKKQKLNFDVCNLEINSIPKNLIQIGADESEMNRRIQCFVEKKREEIDLNNILDFTAVKPTQKDEETCARINGIVPKQKDSKGHLKVQRVKNEIGPQDKLSYTNTLDKLMDNSETDKIVIKCEPEEYSYVEQIPCGVAERLQNAEHFLKVKAGVSKDIYQRLKTIEDKIIFLETVSPEYHHFMRSSVEAPKRVNKRTFSVQDLDSYIAKMKENIANRKADV